MRYVDRRTVPPPVSLTAPSVGVANERARAAAHFAAGGPGSGEPFTFAQFKGHDVCQALSALFHDKCAYCEAEIGATGAREVEHFRPKGKIDKEKGHPGYWWLASEWENLLPSCPACNKRRRHHIIEAGMTTDQVAAILAAPPRQSWGKGTQFPIAGARAQTPTCPLGAEDPLVIDPTQRDPAEHLEWDAQGDFSLVVPHEVAGSESAYGRETIRVFALNRVALVQSRTRVLTELRFHRAKIIDDLNLSAEAGDPDDRRMAGVLDRIAEMRRLAQPTMPYSAMAEAFITKLIAEFGLEA